MKYIKTFNEAKVPPSPYGEIQFANFIDITEELYQSGIGVRLRGRDLVIVMHLGRPISITPKVARNPKNKIFGRNQEYIVVKFMDLNIPDVSDVYKRSENGREDGIYILSEDRSVEDISDDILDAIEVLKDYIDME